MEIRTLSFPADSPPPLPVIVAAKLAGLALPIDTSLPPNSAPTLLFSDGYSFFFFFDKDLFFLPKAFRFCVSVFIFTYMGLFS